MSYCCERLEKAVSDKLVAHDGKGWHINGCCGQCFILSDIVFCPFCASALPARKRATPGAGATKINAKGHTEKTCEAPDDFYADGKSK